MKKKFIFLFFILYSFSVHAGIKNVKFDNGLTVLLKEDHRLPIVSIQLWVKVGSRNEDTTTSGISHLIEHMVFKGTQNYPCEVIQDEVEKRGGVINAGTSRDFTYFYVTLPTGQNNLSIGLDILFQMMRKALFPEDELDREKFVIAEEINRRWDNHQSYLWDLFNSVLYSCHPYSQPVLGTSESIRHISKEDILNYYNKFYVPANCTLVVVGDFKERDIIILTQRIFGGERFFQPSKTVDETKVEPIARKNLEIERPVHQAYLIFGTAGPDAVDDDCYSMDILSYILGKGRYSRLYRKLREEKRLVWSVDCSFLTQKEKGPFYISIECNPDKIPLVKEIIFQELKRISNELVSDDEIKRAKSMFETGYLLDVETYSGEAFNLGYYQTIGSYKIALEYLGKILKVTSRSMQRVARKYFNPQNFISVMIMPPGEK